MKLNLFYLILLFAFLGGIGTYFAGRKQNSTKRKKNWIKYFTYFLIIIFLYGCICFAERIFPCVCLLIVFVGVFEIIRLQKKTPQKRTLFYSILCVYMLVSIGFYFFSNLSQTLLLYTLFTVCTFDSFCQIAGQLFGKNKISPQISPNKTVEGLLGGLFMAVGTFIVVGKIVELSVLFTVVLGGIVCLFAFVGDLSASWVKRVYHVKDFSSALPGHGGFLDRFDSFITAGAFVYLFHLLFTINIQLLYCFLFLLCFLLILVFCEFLHKKGIQSEYTRKLAHSLSTLLCLSVPFFFSSHWYALLFVISSFTMLYIGKRKHLLNSIHAVGRKTYGAFLLPVSIGIAYYISILLQNKLLFILPIVVLAISDPLACFLGNAYKSKILKSGKTVIGTLTFFISTLIISGLFLLLPSANVKTAGIVLGVSIIVSGVELISPNGSDNLTIPLSIIALLVFFDVIL